jgi:diaminopimelate epimerase
VKFTKAHGLGNDFILVEAGACPEDAAPWAVRLCDRHNGVGGDGVLVYAFEPGGVRMRLINPDGGDAEISGNGVRCLAAHAVRSGGAALRHVVRTVPGPRAVEVTPIGGTSYRVVTDLGTPILESDRIPVALEPKVSSVVDHPLAVGDEVVRVTAVSFGNPNCVVLPDAPPDDARLARLGRALETHPFFPQRTNVQFGTVTSRNEIRARIWERGVGMTRASGTGAASVAVAAILAGRADRRLRVVCDGGTLEIEWPEGETLRQTGVVEIVYEGEWLAPA